MADAINLDIGRHAVKLAEQEWGGLRSLKDAFAGLIRGDEQSCKVDGEWFVLNVEPRQENLAKSELAGRGLVPYLPMVPKRERHGRGSERTMWRSMFGPYMFVKCPALPEYWKLVTSARGVHRLLGEGGENGRPLAVCDDDMDRARYAESQAILKEEERAGARCKGRSGLIWTFTPGDIVRITSGPFASFHAQLESAVDVHDRIRALLTLFGRASVVELSAFDISAL